MNAESTPLELDTVHCLALYQRGEFDAVAQLFIDVLQKFTTATYYEVDEQTAHFVNVFTKHFLYILTQPEFLPDDAHLARLVLFNPTIANVVAMSDFGTTDAYLALLRKQPHNFSKILILYNPRCATRFNCSTFFDHDVTMASLWYMTFLTNYRAGCASRNTWTHLREHMYGVDTRMQPVNSFTHHAYFGVTYIDNERDRDVKRVINTGFQNWDVRPVIHNSPKREKVLVVTNMWFRGHSVFRCMDAYLKALAEDFELTLVSLGQPVEVLEVDLFGGRVHTLSLASDNNNLEWLVNNEFSMVFFPDIGMNLESIFLSNLRIAPIQVCGYGHPVSTFGAEIDYWLGGIDTEDHASYAHNYDERLVLITGAGVVPNRPLYQRRDLLRPTDRVRIGCPWTGQKINYPLLCTLAKIVEQSKRDIVFEIYPGAATMHGAFTALRSDIRETLDPASFLLLGDLQYSDYMDHIETCDFTLDSFPFGGYATATDSLFLRKPMVTREGDKFYNRSAASLLRACKLDELITKTEEEMVSTTVRMIDDLPFRLDVIRRLEALDLDNTIFRDTSSRQFKRAMTYLVDNHPELSGSDARTPLIFS
jgi:hypothetical protein